MAAGLLKLVFDKKKNTLDVMPVLPDKGKGKKQQGVSAAFFHL